MSDAGPKRTLPSLGRSEGLSRNEIMDIMADDGYSVDERKNWLKSVLTDLASREDDDPERETLVREIRQILHRQVSDGAIADDTL